MTSRKRLCSGVLAIALSGSCVPLHAANDAVPCRVMDPTGTPLNVRTSPSGRIIGNIPNDMAVSIVDRAVDRSGRPWVYLSRSADGKPIGWVFRDFISCD